MNKEIWQIWAKENLDTDHYSNRDKIPYATNDEEWREYSINKIGCYCYYNYDIKNKKYGAFYNWYAINDIRGLAPKGWKIPSDEDWQVLIDSLGGSLKAGKFLKSAEFYSDNNIKDVKLEILPSGYHGGSYSQLLGFNAHFWTSTEYLDDYAWLRFLTSENDFVGRSFDYKNSGFVVRLIKDDCKQNQKFIKIGNQQWSKFNLDTTKFVNGDDIPIVKNIEELIYYSNNKIPCCCSYNFDDTLVKQFGRLYNWYAVNDSRKLVSPKIGHIPTDEEWTELVIFLGGESKAGDYLKSLEIEWGQDNLSKDDFGFSAQPAGYFGKGYFATLNYNAIFWSTTEYKNQYAWLRLLSYNNSHFDRGFDYKCGGYSIRFLKD